MAEVAEDIQYVPYALPDGRVVEGVPVGTTQEDFIDGAFDNGWITEDEWRSAYQDIESQYAQIDQAAQPQPLAVQPIESVPESAPNPLTQSVDSSISYNVPPTQYTPPFTEEEIFQGLPEPIVQQIRDATAGQYGMNMPQAQNMAELERLRLRNPVMAGDIESMRSFEAAHIGAGALAAKVGRGIGFMDQDPIAQENYETLQSIRPAATVGEVGAEMITAAIAAEPFLARIPVKIVESIVGGTVASIGEFIRSRGEGNDTWENLKRAGLAGLLGFAGGQITSRTRPNPEAKEIMASLEMGADSKVLDDLKFALNENASDDELLQILAEAQAKNLSAGKVGTDLGMDHPAIIRVEEFVKAGNSPRDAVTAAITEQAEIANKDITAGNILIGKGNVRESPAAREAVRQGVEKGYVSSIEGASRPDKNLMQKMLRIYKAGRAKRLYAMEHRPGEVVGEALLDRFRFADQLLKQSGKTIGDIVKNLGDDVMSNKPYMANFLDALEANKVGFKKGGLDFPTGSTFAGKVQKSTQNTLDDIFKQVVELGSQPTFGQLVQLKRQIDAIVFSGKMQSGGLSAPAEQLLKKLRKDIGDSLNEYDPAFAEANELYGMTIEAIDKFQRAVGTSVDLTRESSANTVGIAARKLASNYTSRQYMADAIVDLEAVMRRLNAPPETDVLILNMFANMLEKEFGTTADNSFRGIMDSTFQRALERNNIKFDPVEIAKQIASNSIDSVRNMSDEAALDALEQMVK